MPGGDRTGPSGMGPMTGRGAGYCAGYATPGYANPWGRRCFEKSACGSGRGHRHWFYATGLPFWARGGYGCGYPGMSAWGQAPVEPACAAEQEREALSKQAEALEDQLKALNKRLAELEEKS